MLGVVALQKQQVRTLFQAAPQGIPARFLGALGSVRQDWGRAQAGLTDRAAQPG